MANDFSRLSDAELSKVADIVATALAADPSGYGIVAGDATSIASRLSQFDTSVNAFVVAETALRAASEAKKSWRSLLLSTLGKVSNKVYAAELATNEMLAAAGLSIRETPTAILPKKVLDFIATPNADGTVKLKWERNGNKYGVLFVIEMRPDATAEWEQLLSTQRQSITVSGFTPGVRAEFRCIATNRGLSATPSDIDTIYEDQGESFNLQVAA